MERTTLGAVVGRKALQKWEVCCPFQEHLWGIILAGGEGRLRPFIRACFGVDHPKQYCSLINHHSMLYHTLRRAERLIPPERLLVIITDPHLRYAQEALHDRSLEMLIVQPCNRETGPGILLPLLHTHRRDPEAVVVLLPSDHFIREEARFMAAVKHAAAFVSGRPEYPVLLGVEPTGPEVEYGWIEPGEVLGNRQGEAVYQVRHFWEKPTLEKAADLYLQGYLWNTMVLVARATVLLELFQELTPELMDAFDPIGQTLGSPREAEAIRVTYAKLPAVNFSQAILARCPHRLGVLRVQGVYWSDWGDSERIQRDRARFALGQ
jgi:mannose-1-phosphate guanylyltransferase